MSIFANKTLMITGGTGSFGNAVLNRFLDTDIQEIRIFSRDEKKQDDMRHEFQAKMPEAAGKIKFFIGDVRDLASVKNAMHGVDYIFHAAALKQVPSCEFFPMEAVKTNVFGTDNVLTAAINAGVKAVICLSTDKAAYPVNAMGTSKAMMEKVIVAKSRTVSPEKTKICCTRYGNVMCSRGSVIPLWIDQIKAGNPITITEPNMTRFIMSLEEAVDLVLFAFQNGVSGDILVQKAPACTIETLAKAVTGLFAPGHEIKVIGIRHGEKMYETAAWAGLCSAVQRRDGHPVRAGSAQKLAGSCGRTGRPFPAGGARPLPGGGHPAGSRGPEPFVAGRDGERRVQCPAAPMRELPLGH